MRGASRLDAFRCLSGPGLATLLCTWQYNRYTSCVDPSRSSRTKDSSSQISYAHCRIGTQLFSRRSEPSSRTALMGEEPNPWDLLQPQDAMSRHRGAKPLRRCELLGVISLLAPGSFYPLSDGNPTLYHRITKSYFRTCSTRRCRSQAPFCLCTLPNGFQPF